jgi:hypothetical protein
MTYTLEHFKTPEEFQALTKRYALEGLHPMGQAIKLGDSWSVAFSSNQTSNGKHRSVYHTQGWPSQNILYTLAKVGLGQSSKKLVRKKKNNVTKPTTAK